MKHRLVALAAACLIALGALGDRVLSAGSSPSPTVEAQTASSKSRLAASGQSTPATQASSSTANITAASIDQATEQAYATASRSVVYIVSQDLGSGSGNIFDGRGDIVTNNHVINRATSISVTLSTGKTYSARVVGTDTADDLAVIRINASNLTPAHFAAAGGYAPAQMVLAVGNPLDLKSSVTSGLISGLHRVEQEENGAYLSDAIQTSAPINPGNSGGALVTLSGTVVGMPTLVQSSTSNGTTAQNIGFAIPSERIVLVADQIIAHGKVTHTGRPYLGIAPRDASGQLGGFFPGQGGQGATTTSGALVSQVASGGPAAGAGIQQGDVITRADGSAITDAQDLLTVLASKKPGDSVSLTLNRNGSTQTVTVTLAELPASS